MYEVKGRRAIITGGAQGFGREFGIRLVGAGCKVCLADLDEKKGEETKKELQKRYGLKEDSVCFVKCNVAIKEDWVHLWDEAEKILGGKIDILCNNAGINPLFGWELNLDVMLVGATRGAFLAVERMGRSNGGNGGRIINTASMAGVSVAVLGDMNAAGYTVAKHGVVSLTRCFRSSTYNKEGVKCYTLCPWFADTQLVRSQLELSKQKETKVKGRKVTSMDELAKATYSRVLTPEEVGDALMMSLKLDKNSAVYSVMPDSPLIEWPDYKTSTMYMIVGMAKYIGANLGMEHFGPNHIMLVLALGVIIFYHIFSHFLSHLFSHVF